MKVKGTVLVECTNPHWAFYEVQENGQLSSSGKFGSSPGDAGVPLIPGLQYAITFEVVGLGNDKPRLCWYWPRWADPERQRMARQYFKSKREQRKAPDVRAHMRHILTQAKASRAAWERDLRFWNKIRRNSGKAVRNAVRNEK